MADHKKLTRAFGQPVGDDQNTMTAGPRGPVLLQDVHFLEKMSHFDRERIPERVVHAKGNGAYGYFEVTHDVSKYTKAAFLTKVGKRTEVFARFSTVGGEKGSADTERDPRGFALKFYTEEGNYDMVGNNTPIFFIRDPLKFPDFIHTQKRRAETNLKCPTMFWDFLSLTPESLHQIMILFSDRGTPHGYRHMHGFSSHTYKWYNAAGEYFWVKYHFLTDQGIKNFTGQEAEDMRGKDPDFAGRDLFEHIEKGDFPSWTFHIQVMSPEQGEKYRFDIFDITKVWFHGDFPLIPVGKLVLNRNPVDFFAEVEQSAFNPSNFVPGITASPDKMLQGRLFSYHDTHLHRLGANYHQIPVNAPKHAPEASNQRDGPMNTVVHGAPDPNYWPNSMGGPAPRGMDDEPPIALDGEGKAQAYTHLNDDFLQPGEMWRRAFSTGDRHNFVGNVVGHMGGAIKRVQYRQTSLFYRADQEMGARIAEGLKLDLNLVKKLADMSAEERAAATTEEKFKEK